MFVQLSENPDFADKINLFVPLAPVASVIHAKTALLKLLDFTHAGYILQEIGYHNFLAHMNSPEPEFMYLLCDKIPALGEFIVQLIADGDISVDNVDRFPVIFSHMPCGTSTRNMIHYEQMKLQKQPGFCKYDWGKSENKNRYNQEDVPCYDLTKIKANIAWYVGSEDLFSQAEDIAWLKSQINPDVLVKAETLEKFGHFTVVWGKNMTFFEDVIELTRKFSSEAKQLIS